MNRILIVDDEPLYRQCLERALASRGYDVVTADAADTAVSAMADEPADLLICDWHLGVGATGLGVAQALEEHHCSAKAAIAITGMSDIDLLEEISAAFDALLFKPFTVDQLIDLVQRELARPHQTSSSR